MSKLKPNQFEIRPGVIITERPILFQTEMVRANLDDRKTQTRRTKKFDHLNEDPNLYELDRMQVYPDESLRSIFIRKEDGFLGSVKSPYGKPGDLLWVRENYINIELRNYYKADGAFDEIIETYDLDKIRWKPSIHMPKAASRIWAMVEEIRVERVQDISEEDARSEGAKYLYYKSGNCIQEGFKDFESYYSTLSSYKQGFHWLWESINGEASWKSNPWVWVVKYRILSKTGRPTDEVIWENYADVIARNSLSRYVGKAISSGQIAAPRTLARNDGRKEASNV